MISEFELMLVRNFKSLDDKGKVKKMSGISSENNIWVNGNNSYNEQHPNRYVGSGSYSQYSHSQNFSNVHQTNNSSTSYTATSQTLAEDQYVPKNNQFVYSTGNEKFYPSNPNAGYHEMPNTQNGATHISQHPYQNQSTEYENGGTGYNNYYSGNQTQFDPVSTEPSMYMNNQNEIQPAVREFGPIDVIYSNIQPNQTPFVQVFFYGQQYIKGVTEKDQVKQHLKDALEYAFSLKDNINVYYDCNGVDDDVHLDPMFFVKLGKKMMDFRNGYRNVDQIIVLKPTPKLEKWVSRLGKIFKAVGASDLKRKLDERLIFDYQTN